MSKFYPCVYCTEDGYCEKYSDEEVKSWCVQGPCKDERPSNADRIRAMTDEELAEWMASRMYSAKPINIDYLIKACLEWLKKEVDA